MDTTGIIVFHLTNHKIVTVECETINAAIEEVIAYQFDIETTLKEILADAQREYGVGAVKPYILLVAVGMHHEVGLE